MRRLEWRLVVVGTVAILASVWIHFARVPVDASSAAPRVNFRAPEFSLATMDRHQVSSSDLRGQVVMLNFWATWCVPCRAEMPEIQAAYENYRSKNFTVLAIDVGEDEQTVARFVQDLGLLLPILLDRNREMTRRYNVRALPTTFFVDRTGVIRAVKFGEMSRAYIEEQLGALLPVER